MQLTSNVSPKLYYSTSKVRLIYMTEIATTIQKFDSKKTFFDD